MQIDQSLIKRFLENRCDAEEAARVHQYLAGHPEILQEYYRQDWENAGPGGGLDRAHATGMYQAISERRQVSKTARLRYLPWMAAAAVVLIAMSTWLYKPAGQPRPAPAQIATIKPPVQHQPVAVSWQQQHNTTGSRMKVKLPDGSLVTLAPAAVIKYNQALEPDKRNVILEGEALFEVVKDKTRPFTVYSGSLSTTALGTSFRVTSKLSSVRVQLLTGKVVVKAIKTSLPGWKQDVYLLPGQQMNYDGEASLVKVSRTAIDRQPAAMPAIVHQPGQEMVFDNTPLPRVLDKLAQHHKITIAYTAEELKGLTFSGTVFYSDSLPVILQAIGRMNDLLVTTAPGGFSLRKDSKE